MNRCQPVTITPRGSVSLHDDTALLAVAIIIITVTPFMALTAAYAANWLMLMMYVVSVLCHFVSLLPLIK